jgi:hypothetical protein
MKDEELTDRFNKLSKGLKGYIWNIIKSERTERFIRRIVREENKGARGSESRKIREEKSLKAAIEEKEAISNRRNWGSQEARQAHPEEWARWRELGELIKRKKEEMANELKGDNE